MAIGQKRSNREIRKPKAKKPPTPGAPTPLVSGSVATIKQTNKNKQANKKN